MTGVIENVTTGHLIDGHARIEEALSRDENEPVPFIQVELSEHEEALVLTALDPLGAMATADKNVLESLLNEISTGDAGLQAMLADLAQREGITPPDFQPVGADQQGRLDERAKTKCPECGAEFTP